MIRRAYLVVAWILVVLATAGVLALWFAPPAEAMVPWDEPEDGVQPADPYLWRLLA